MRRFVVLLTVLLLVVLVLPACGQRPQAAADEEAAAAPTEKPTSSPIAVPTSPPAPTKTPVPTSTPEPTSEPVAQPELRAALEQSVAASVFRMEMDLSVTGVPPEMMAGLPAGPGMDGSMFHLTGAVNDNNMHMTVTGMFVSFIGADPEQGLELIVLDNQSYIRGPIAMLGAPEARWYAADPSMGGISEVPTSPDDLTGELQNEELDELLEQLEFTHMGREELDGQQCDVYGMDREAFLAAMEEIDTGESYDEFDPDQIETAEMKAWICDDGYLHQVRMNLEGYDESMPGQKVGIDLFLHFYDFGGDIAITAPIDAVPLEEPDFANLFGEFEGGFGDTPSGDWTETADPFADEFGDMPSDEWTESADAFEHKLDDMPSGHLTATVYNGGNIRAAPNLQGQVLGQLHAGQTIILHERTTDTTWYRVDAPEASGWVSATLLTVDGPTVSQVPVAGQDQLPAAPDGPLAATVSNGGNVRAVPRLQGLVLDQVHAYETVQLLGKNSRGTWYKIANPRDVTGWVSGTLLKVDPSVAVHVPVEPGY